MPRSLCVGAALIVLAVSAPTAAQEHRTEVEVGGGYHAALQIGDLIEFPSVPALASSAESVGMLRLRQVAKCVIQSDFQRPAGAKPICPFGNHSGLAVEALDNATGELPLGSEPVEDQVAVRAQHAGHLLHRVEPRAHRPSTPAVEKLSRPVRRHVAP